MVNKFKKKWIRSKPNTPIFIEPPVYEYMEVEILGSIGEAANWWAGNGWRTVSVAGFSDNGRPTLLLERAKQHD